MNWGGVFFCSSAYLYTCGKMATFVVYEFSIYIPDLLPEASFDVACLFLDGNINTVAQHELFFI